jgi:hypothetical protein
MSPIGCSVRRTLPSGERRHRLTHLVSRGVPDGIDEHLAEVDTVV